jgi:hypothetical protein
MIWIHSRLNNGIFYFKPLFLFDILDLFVLNKLEAKLL